MTGAAIGMALAGLRPIHVHIRMDFLLLAMNQLVNVAAKSRYMYGGQVSRAAGRPRDDRQELGPGGAALAGAAQRSSCTCPASRWSRPTTPYDAKGCLIAGIRDDNPVLFVEHRLLHFQKGPVPEEPYTVPPARRASLAAATTSRSSASRTCRSSACGRREYLEDVGIAAEVIDPIWLSPLDIDTIADRSSGPAGCSSWIRLDELRGRRGDRRPRRRAAAGRARPSASSGWASRRRPARRRQPLEDLFYPNAPHHRRRRAATWSRGRDRLAAREQSSLAEILEFKGPF